MNNRKLPDNKLLWHLAAILLLMAVHLLVDYQHFQQRESFYKFAPYLFLLMLYGWIIFHNLILFERLFLAGKKRAYFIWTSLALLISSLNMYFIIFVGFKVSNPLQQIINFWLYTFLGLGIYMTFRFLKEKDKASLLNNVSYNSGKPEACHFEFTANGKTHRIAYDKIIYLESMENYVKIYTPQKSYLARMPLKEAEQCLPAPFFIRISRSKILNTVHIHTIAQDSVRVGEKHLKVGKVYKKYVEDHLASLKLSPG